MCLSLLVIFFFIAEEVGCDIGRERSSIFVCLFCLWSLCLFIFFVFVGYSDIGRGAELIGCLYFCLLFVFFLSLSWKWDVTLEGVELVGCLSELRGE